jgi:hypothetical protein
VKFLDSNPDVIGEWFVPEGTMERIASTGNRIRNRDRVLRKIELFSGRQSRP